MAAFSDINNGGAVAVEFVAPGGLTSIRILKNGNATTIVETGPMFDGLNPPTINNRGEIAFRGHIPSPPRDGIFKANGKTITSIAEAGDVFELNFPFPTSINDRGVVAFAARLVGGGKAILTGNGETIGPVADTNGPYADFPFGLLESSSPAINKSGIVAFSAWLDDGRKGIFTGPDPVADKVITTGETLFGSQVRELIFAREGLNDRGQIAFYACLLDGTCGIYRADPKRKREHHDDKGNDKD